MGKGEIDEGCEDCASWLALALIEKGQEKRAVKEQSLQQPGKMLIQGHEGKRGDCS